METKKEIKKRLCVEYKGGELILNPGHKVFELDLKTGFVTEYKLIRKFTLVRMILGKAPKYRVDTSDNNKLHLPAFSIEKAQIAFKNLVKSLGIIVKIKY